jgi:DNA polymerase III subunit chi
VLKAMAETTVYFVESKAEELPVAVCQWVEHFYEQGMSVQVLVGSSLAAQRLDHLLWTFAQASFIPHRIGLPSATGVIIEPVIITLEAAPVRGATVLVSEGAVGLESLRHYEHVVHFVLLDDPEKRLESRSLWQAVREKGLQARHIAYSSKGRPVPTMSA